MHFSLTLAHIQKGLIEALKPSRHQPVARQIQAGLVAFWVWKNNSAYVSAVRWYINLLAESTQLFNGIRVFGRFFSRAWVVRSTYGGIIEAFSRNSGLDHYPGCATFILESNKAEDGEWLDFIEVELPPTTIEWEYKQLTIVVVAAKNRKNDTSVSPLLLLSMRSMFGAPILNLPDNKPLNITLPRMWGGTLEPSRHRYLTDTIHRDHNWKDYSREINRLMTSYKIELPVEYDSWVVEIQVNVMVPLKVIVTDKIPDPLLLSAKPDIYPVYDSSKKKYLAYEEVLPAAGHQFIPSYFYLAISPSFESTNVTSITLNLQRTTDVCYVENTRFLEVDSTERSICKGLNRFGDYNTIQCNCKRLGLIQARRYPISINKLLIGEIPFIFPRNKFTYVNIIIIGIFISFIVATFVIAVCKDRSSQKQETLIYVEDNYPSDDYIMVVGVFTGLYLQGGTKSKVGIMLIGENSSSRVHILASRKRRTLATGQDDWFVITLPHPPGKITRISLWRDHRDMSGWFCDRIIVYDPSENTLYVASMEKWMEVTIMEETKKIQTLEVIQVGSVGNRGSVHDMSHTFTKNYVREYRNTHDLFSIYTMHSRYLVTYEVKSHIIIVKVCFIYFWVWFIQEVAHLLTNGQYLYPVVISGIADIRLETFTWALWAALLSHPFTYALDYFYRSAHLSRVLQKKTTNPYYLNTAAESLARSGSFSMRPSTRRITSGAPRQTRSSFKSHHRPSEFKYSKHTLGSNKFANSRIAHRRGYLRLAVGPSQFRCVDVNSETIALKTRKAETSVRFVSIFIFFSFLGFILYVQFWTAFTWKWKTSAFVFCFAIVLDVFILGPLFIFIKSSIAFYIYHLSNKEPFLMSDDVKVHQPLRTKYVDYLEKATRKEYKLPLNADINAAKRKKLIMITVKRTIFQVIALLAMYCVHDILVDKYNEEHFTLMRILKDATTAARNRHGFQGTDPKDVHDFTSASNYVSNTIAALTGIWPNGQRIGGSSRETGMRWTYDSFGQGMGSSSVLLLYIADTDEKLTVPLEFEEYFTAAIGYYSESFPEKDPLIISDTTLNYTVVSEMVIVGNSKEVYPLAGHLKLIPLKPWGTYYSQMRILMNDVMIKEEDHDCRAVIISTNYVYPYVQYLATVDVLIEFLPSGVSDVYIQTRGIKSGAMTHNRMKILRFIIAAILLCFLVYTFAAIGKVGIKAYFREPYNIIKFLIFLTNLATVVCYFLRYPLKYGAISRLIHAAINEYRDVHPIFVYELTDSILLLLFFTAMLVDFMLVIPKLIGSPWLNRLCISCIKIVFIALLLQLYLISLVKVTMRVMYRTFGLFFIIVHTHQPPTSIDHYAQVEGLAFFISVIVLTIFSKFVLSMVIYRSLLINAPKDLPLKMYVDILKRNHLDTEHSGRVFPVPAIFHWRSRTKSTESIGQNQQPNALSLMSGRVASKHQIFL